MYWLFIKKNNKKSKVRNRNINAFNLISIRNLVLIIKYYEKKNSKINKYWYRKNFLDSIKTLT